MKSILSVSVSTAMLLGMVFNLTLATARHNSSATPATPITHLVVIFGENESFDHYLGTYPTVVNPLS